MIADIYPYMILSGAVILLACFYLLLKIRQQRQLSQQLIALNETCNFDLLEFIRASWPLLRSGGFNGLQTTIEWFGTPLQMQYGDARGSVLLHSCSAGEIKLELKLFCTRNRWEQQLVGALLSDTLFTLLPMNIWMKVGSVRTAFEQSAKKSVYLKHDIRNLLQLIQLSMPGNYQGDPASQQQTLDLLNISLPTIQERVQRLESIIDDNQRPPALGHTPIADALTEALYVHGVQADIRGEATLTSVPLASLRVILDYILTSCREFDEHTELKRLSINIERNKQLDKVCIVFSTATMIKSVLELARIFEPFWSEQGGPRSIGLYNSRRMAQQWGGDLQANNSDGKLSLSLQLPAL